MDKVYDVPIVLFTFRRLETVQMIINQICRVKPQILYVFGDGARSEVIGEKDKVLEVKKYLESAIDWDCDTHIYFSNKNKGCDKNIRDGLDKVFSEQSKAIVFEDDAVPVLDFFDFCRELLLLYENNKNIQYIAGFNAIGKSNLIKEEYTFGKSAPMSGAFATWSDRWNECDFDLTSWPVNKANRRFDDFFYSREFRNKTIREFDDVYKKKITAWDYIYKHDMLNRDRLAIVPKNNLATSYGYIEGAFHPQEKKEAERLLKIMTATDKRIEFPIKYHDVIWNREYDYLRQKKMLEVKGNYIERTSKRLYLTIKDIIYKWLPPSIWNGLKEVLTKKER